MTLFLLANLLNLLSLKIRYAVTDMRKLANRMAFGTPEESSLGNKDLVHLYLLMAKGS